MRRSRVRGTRRLAASLLLVAFAFIQQPGVMVADTKTDLLLDPVGFLRDAWHLWDPTSASGQLGNQAYGYLFPMGPFFALGDLLQLAPWMVQRCWWALVMVVAFNGAYVLASRLGIGTPTTRLIAALAYALSPRLVGALGAISIEVWPLALAPWVVAPLVRGSERGDVRTAAARSGLAVLCVGGVNAVATLAVLPLAGWWLVTRAPGPRRRRLIAWWSLSVGLATAWWVVPLLLLGRYSPPFLDWIESASVTTGVASPANAVRGATHWVGYLPGTGQGQWPAAWALVTEPVLVLATGLVAAFGVAGLCWPRLPHRGFLVGGLLIGIVLVTFGHVGPGAGPAAGLSQDLLDGALAPFRNTHKFDPVVRLPVALGLAHLLSVVRFRPVRQVPGAPYAARALAAVAVAAAAAPAVAGVLPQPGGFRDLPDHWPRVAGWLDRQPGGGRSLVVPGAMAAAFVWGGPRDEPLQALARRPWAVRDGVPLGSAGNTRVLNAVESVLASGRGSPALDEFLARAGIRFVVVRNDLDWRATGAPQPIVLRQALDRSPGLSLVRRFGPVVGGTALPEAFPDDGLDLPFRAVEVWRVGAFRADAEVWDARTTLRVGGGPEALLPLAERGWVDARPVVLAGDDQASALRGRHSVVTDTLRRRENNFGSVRTNTSQTLAADERFRAARAVHDYLPFDPAGHQTVAAYVGATRLSASSSGSDAAAVRERSPAHAPYSAFDGDPDTSWRSGSFGGAVGQWLRVDFTQPREVPSVEVTVPEAAGVAAVTRVRIETERGRVDADLGAQGVPSRVAAPAGTASWLRLTVLAADGSGDLAAGFSEVAVPGLDVQRWLRVPADQPGATGTSFALDAAPGARDACVFAGERPLCGRALARDGEEPDLRRTVTTTEESEVVASGTVRPLPGPELDRLLAPVGAAIRARASSVNVPDPAARPQTVVDRDLGTGWVAAPDDNRPRLTLSWPGDRLIDEVQLLVDPALPASRPADVIVRTPAGQRTVAVDREGYLRFPAVRTGRLQLEFGAVDRRYGIGRTGQRAELPVGVSEVRIPAVDELRRGLDPAAAVRIPCGFAPSIQVDGRTVLTTVAGTVRDVLQLRPLALEPCGDAAVRLDPGRHRVEVRRSAELVPEAVTLDAGLGQAAAPEVPEVRQWEAEHRTLAVAPAAHRRVLVVHENSNAGWAARLGDRSLTGVRIDGWQQGWLIPAGAGGELDLFYEPGRPYRAGLVVGLGLGGLLAGLALVRPRAPKVATPLASVHRPHLAAAAGGVALVAAAGLTAAAAIAVAAVVLLLVRRGGRQLPSLVAAAATATAAALVALDPWPERTSLEQPAQVLVLVGVTLALLGGYLSGRDPSAGAPDARPGSSSRLPSPR